MRLWAWRSTPQPGKGDVEIAEPFNCARDCRRADGTWDKTIREARACGLGVAQGLPTVRRDGATALALYHPSKATPYMGRYPNQQLAGTTQLGRATNWQAPLEDPRLGCPGAWYRTPYIDSLAPYYRRRDGNGGRIHNPRFDAADWQIQKAIMLIEEEEERWHRYIGNEQHGRAIKRAEEHAAAAAKERHR